MSNTVRAKRPLYGPHPTQSTNHTHAREYVVARGSRHGQPNRVTPDDGRLHCPCSRLGGHSDRETPGPIPNPEAKPDSADGTAPARVRESRTPPSTHFNWPGTATSGSGPVTHVLAPTTHSTPPRDAGARITMTLIPPAAGSVVGAGVTVLSVLLGGRVRCHASRPASTPSPRWVKVTSAGA